VLKELHRGVALDLHADDTGLPRWSDGGGGFLLKHIGT
jgi:hypothetical protein